MTRADKAAMYFGGNFNCAQSVFSTFAPDLDLDRVTAWKIATPFGGGLSHMREVCGAVTGALMAVGLKYGMTEDGDLEAKDKSYTLAQEFAARFIARHGSINCQKLIGYDLDNPEEYEKAKAEGVFDRMCTNFIRNAVEILEDFM